MEAAISLYKREYGVKAIPFRAGKPTKKFLRQQKREITAGRSNYWADPTSVFNPDTGRVVRLSYDKRHKTNPPLKASSVRALDAATQSIAKRYRPAQISLIVQRGGDQYALRAALKSKPELVGRLNYRLTDKSGRVIKAGYANYDGSNRSYMLEFDLALRSTSDTMLWDDSGGGTLEVGKMVRVDSTAASQIFREGNINCLMKVIMERAERNFASAISPRQIKRYRIITANAKKLNEQFKEGVAESDLQYICDATQSRIRIYQPLLDIPSWEVVPLKGRHKTTYNYVNTGMNHVEGALKHWGVAVAYETPVLISQVEMDNKVADFRRNEVPFVMELGCLGPCSVRCNDGAFVVKDVEFQNLRNKWEKDNDLEGCWIDAVKYPKAVKFILAGTHFNGTRNYKPVPEDFPNTHGHIDGYRMYKTAANTTPVLGRITDFAKTDRIQSIGLYRIANTDTSKCSKAVKFILGCHRDFVDGMVLTSTCIEFYRELGATCDITEGLWGIESSASMAGDDASWDEMIQTGWKRVGLTTEASYSRRYSKHFGMLAANDKHIKTLISGTNDYYGAILEHDTTGNLEIWTNGKEGDDYAIALTPKTQQIVKAHITAFITSASRIMLMKQLLKMDHTKLTRVDSDGISFEEHDFELLPTFKRKSKTNYANTPWSRLVSGEPLKNDDDCLPSAQGDDFGMNIQVKGPGGSGKSYDCGMNTTHINPIYVAHSRQLERDFRSKFPHIQTYVYNDLLHGEASKRICARANNIYADECTMLSGITKKVLRDKLKGRIFWIGDPDCQLLAFNHFHHNDEQDKLNHDQLKNKDPSALKLNDVEDVFYDRVIEKEFVYRFKEPMIAQLAGEMRNLIKTREYGAVYDTLIKHVPTITQKEMNYRRKDSILSATKSRCYYWTDKFKDIEKYVVIRNGTDWSNGDIRYDKPSGCAVEQKHGFTIHSFQGGTIYSPNRLFIDTKGLGTGEEKDARLIYIACSRVERLEQVILVRN